MATTTALVTGANQGLGYALVQHLCQSLPSSSKVFLAARSEERGRDACKAIAAEANIQTQPILLVLDVGKDESVSAARKCLEGEHGVSSLDVLIHNAASRIDKETDRKEQVGEFFNVNNQGTIRMIREFSPLVTKRFVVVSSSFGQLLRLPPSLQPNFDETVQTTLQALEEQQQAYVADVISGEDVKKGYPDWINIVSKIAQVTAVKIGQRDAKAAGQATRFISICPGLIQTEASRPWFDAESFAKAPLPSAVAKDVISVIDSEDIPDGVLVQAQEHKVLPWR